MPKSRNIYLPPAFMEQLDKIKAKDELREPFERVHAKYPWNRLGARQWTEEEKEAYKHQRHLDAMRRYRQKNREEINRKNRERNRKKYKEKRDSKLRKMLEGLGGD